MSSLDQKVFLDATARIKSWRRPLLVTHAKADGDALGSLVAMRSLLAAQGIDALALLFDPVPSRYDVFRRYQALPVLGTDVEVGDLSTVDGVVILDTCSYAQLDPLADWLRAAFVSKIAVDHHVTRDDLADVYLVDESAAANCLILYDWARAADWPLDEHARDALFIGIAMDTGWFRHSNTDARVLAAGADLIGRGVTPHELYQQLFLRETPGRLRLLGAALGRMELLIGDRVAIMTLPQEVFPQTGAAAADTEDIVSEPLRIESVVVSVLLVERGDGVVRTSFRSKAPIAPDAPDVDVAAVAQAFGGGGHRRAAGARITGSLNDVRRKVVDHFSDVFRRLSG